MHVSPARTFKDLIVWQKAHSFVLSIYDSSRSFPNYERYGLTSQLRRAAVSIPSNIAEGFKRRTIPEKCRYLNIAQSSLEECRYYLILANDLDYCNSSSELEQLSEVSKLLQSYYSAILDPDS